MIQNTYVFIDRPYEIYLHQNIKSPLKKLSAEWNAISYLS